MVVASVQGMAGVSPSRMMRNISLGFLDTYRTMCIAPSSDFRQVLEDVRELKLAT